MAKKKADGSVGMTQQERLDALYKEINAEFGKGVLCGGEELVEEAKTTQVIPTCPTVDMIIGGGIREGSWVGVTGDEKLGKTTLILGIAANAQKPEFGSRPVFYGNVEGRITDRNVLGVKGLNPNKPHFNMIRSVEGRILTGEEQLRIYTHVLRTIPGAVLIIDSISAMCSEKEHNEFGAETRGAGAKMFSQWIRTMNNVVPVNRSIVLGVTHLICDSGNPMAGKRERAARMWGYTCDYQLRALYQKAWKAGEDQIGQTVRWACKTSALSAPGKQIDSYLRYGVGFDGDFEIFTFGKAAGLIEQGGAWYTLKFLRNHPELVGAKEWTEEVEKSVKAQGEEKAFRLLTSRPDWVSALREDVLSLVA